jgi:hypothetical protein
MDSKSPRTNSASMSPSATLPASSNATEASSVSPHAFPQHPGSHAYFQYSSSNPWIAGPSHALTTFVQANALEGPPSEWIHAGVSRCARFKESKERLAVWDKEWAALVGQQ